MKRTILTLLGLVFTGTSLLTVQSMALHEYPPLAIAAFNEENELISNTETLDEREIEIRVELPNEETGVEEDRIDGEENELASEDEPEDVILRNPSTWDTLSDIPSLIQEGDPNFPDFHNVATLAQLGTAISVAPTGGSIRVINVTSNLAFATAAPTAANGRDITAGRNIVIQSTIGINLTATTVRHFNVTGAASRLILNEGITIRRVAEPGTTVGTGVGGGITLVSGTLRLNGAHLHGLATNSNTGAAVHQTGGTFEMFAGEISYNRNNHGTIGTFGATARAGGAGLRMTAGVFNFHGGVFHNNRTPSSGGAILISSNASTMNMFGGSIYNNLNGGGLTMVGTTPGSEITGQGSGALGITGGGNFNMFGGEFRDNFTVGTGGDGGAIESGSSVAGAAGRNSVNLFGGRFIGNIGRQGGAINNHHNSDLLLGDPTTVPMTNIYGYLAVQNYLTTGVIFEQNTARGAGGAIAQRGDTATIAMNGGTIRNNDSVGNINEGGFPGGSGGGIFLNTGTMTMSGGLIQENIAQNNMAAIAAANTLQGGGGIYVGTGTTLTINNGTIRGNETGTREGTAEFTASGGGGIHNRGTFHFNGGEISGNTSGHTAATSGGGGIHLGAGTFTMGDVSITNNTSSSTGGGIEMMTTGTLTVTDGLIRSNTATGVGGGINVSPTLTTAGAATITAAATAMPTLTITGGTIEENTAGIALGEQINFAPTRAVPSPTTAGNGQTIPTNTMTIGGDARIGGNVHYGLTFNLTRAGAGAMTAPPQTLTIGGDARIDGQLTIAPTLSSAGAGTAARTMTYTFNLMDNAQVLNGIDFRPTITQSRSAGTTAFNTNINFNVSGSSNVAGGLTIAPALTTTNTGTTAFHNTNTFTFAMSDTATIRNSFYFTPDLTHSGGTGGTAANSSRVNTVNFNLTGGTLYGGNPQENGGALRYVPLFNNSGGAAATVRTNNSNFNLDEGTIRDGVATRHGGGIYHHPTSHLGAAGTHNLNARLRNVTITNNQAKENGGGIYLDFTTSGGTSPTPNVHLSEDGNYTRTITENTATQNGGGLFLTENFNLTANTIANGLITYNTALEGSGGGIFIETPTNLASAAGTFTINNTTISNNASYDNGASIWFNRFANFTMNNSHLDNNLTQTGNGGGLHFSPLETAGTITLIGSNTINENRAPVGDGGGVWLENSTLNSQNGTDTINGNHAYNGGGIFTANSELNLTNTTLEHNVATENGGAIYVGEQAQLNLIDARLVDNASGQNGGAIFTEIYESEPLLSSTAYGNLNISNTYFLNNRSIRAFLPPLNAEMTNIDFTSTSIHDHPLNNHDINYEGEALTFELTFVKTSTDFDQPLPGAVFELHLYQEGEWLLLSTEESDENGIVSFEGVTPNLPHRLIEVFAPTGYRLPLGHWVIEFNDDGLLSIVAEGDLMPAFRVEGGVHFLGNMSELDVPNLGGLGQNGRLIVLSLVILFSAITLGIRFFIKKEAPLP